MELGRPLTPCLSPGSERKGELVKEMVKEQIESLILYKFFQIPIISFDLNSFKSLHLKLLSMCGSNYFVFLKLYFNLTYTYDKIQFACS